ncbi:sulfotransferase [Spiribacter vilamensis]|uniref:Glycosyltransferase involved in cell wall biosynthesis n=1 Tax=Spiribacter vilamensis TaxID=531306 RepID=A0A4Q8D1B0_9GAMM|nr:sulfotransferase [Spiribacter vilamensis]RZU99030.1 glycosyltransferase involved in cell wall biosynthesis [Spiribacter vilamensis]TVO61968.1 glycosyltransferase [Spiribacter vilamensis]
MLRIIADWLGLIGSGLRPRRSGVLRNGPRRWAASLGLGLLLPFALAYYWSGLWLDELLFRGYRRRPVNRPVFIVGVPRSGTTALHEALARDPQFTTQRTWECVLAPSISHRYLWRGLARLDRLVGRPLQRLGGWINRRWLAPLTDAHPLSAHAPEEDYLSLLPQLSAFILVVAFPDSQRLWRLGRGDAALTPAEQDRLMTRYRRSIQRHLHFHATDRTYLAKNASHATLVATLQRAFPDARFIACLRDPAEAVSSQLSSLTPGLEALHGRIDRDVLSERMLRQLHFGYTNLLSVLPGLEAGRAVFVPLPAQRHGLADTIRAVYSTLSLPLEDGFAQQLAELDRRAREHRSGHRHSLGDYRLDAGQVGERFADIDAAFDFAGTRPVAAAGIHALEPRQRVVVVSDAAPRRNGVGTYYNDLIDHLQDEVATLRLIAAGDPDHPLSHWYEAGLPGDATQRIALPSPFELHRAIAEAQPDVLIVATPGPYGVLAGLMAKGLGARLIFGLHTDYEALATLYWGRLLGPVQRWLMARVNGLLFRRAAVVVSNSAHMHQLAMDKGARQIERVHTPIPRDFLDTEVPPLELPPRRILFVGRLAAEKRVETVIEAAEADPRCHFEIVGEGPERAAVTAAAERLDNLTYRGWLDRGQLRDALDASDLLVLPSRVEAFGTVALEAMVRGRLALVSPGCGIADWPEFADGLLVMDRDETVAQALARVRGQPTAQLAERGATARRQAVAMTRRCIHEWLALIRP